VIGLIKVEISGLKPSYIYDFMDKIRCPDGKFHKFYNMEHGNFKNCAGAEDFIVNFLINAGGINKGNGFYEVNHYGSVVEAMSETKKVFPEW